MSKGFAILYFFPFFLKTIKNVCLFIARKKQNKAKQLVHQRLRKTFRQLLTCSGWASGEHVTCIIKSSSFLSVSHCIYCSSFHFFYATSLLNLWINFTNSPRLCSTNQPIAGLCVPCAVENQVLCSPRLFAARSYNVY